MNKQNLVLIYATTFSGCGDIHSDVDVVVCTQAEADRIIASLTGKRTPWERDGQDRPSVFAMLDCPDPEIDSARLLRMGRDFRTNFLKVRGLGLTAYARLWDESVRE